MQTGSLLMKIKRASLQPKCTLLFLNHSKCGKCEREYFTVGVLCCTQRELISKVNTYFCVITEKALFFTYTLPRPPGPLNFPYILRCHLCSPLSASLDANYLSVFFSGCGLSDYIFEFLGFTFDFWIKHFMKW